MDNLSLSIKQGSSQLKRINIAPITLFFIFFIPVLIWSATAPHNTLTWAGESLPVFIGIALLLKRHHSSKITPFIYITLYIAASLMLIGAHYTFSHVPLFDYIKEYFDLQRNNFDKLGHFFQGFMFAAIIKEFFIRTELINVKRWVNFLALTFATAMSAGYEIVEWLAVETLLYFGSTKRASEFLGAQNYFWDAQSDIFFAVLGAVTALYIFGVYHEKQIKELLFQPRSS